MSIKFDHVYQIKVTLKEIRPPIWRRILVPCHYSFWDLHVAIQDAMGWEDHHRHAFRLRLPAAGRWVEIGIPDDEFGDEHPVLPGWEIDIAEVLTLACRKMSYEYDFGDGWEHTVRLEKIFPAEKGAQYPACIGGRRACPPEDCGGVSGYEELLAALNDPRHPEHAELREWVGGSYDPNEFDKRQVHFDDPYQRWVLAFRPEPEIVSPPPPGAPDGGPVRAVHPADADPSVDSSPAGGSGERRGTGRVQTGQGQGREDAVRELPDSVEQLREQARAGFHGFPIATVALYGPDDRRATKVAVGIMASEEAEPYPLNRWYVEEGDVRASATIGQEILTFVQRHRARTVVLADRIMGCPHEEGIDYPEGEVCPECPFWAYHDRWTGEPIQ